jgi:hypothetical protein
MERLLIETLDSDQQARDYDGNMLCTVTDGTSILGKAA